MGLTACDLSLSFDGKTVLDSISFALPDRGLYAVVGRSGEGKTTLLRVIASLEAPTAGTVEGNERVAFMFQEYRLFEHLTAIDNITMLLHQRPRDGEAAARALLSRLGLTEQEQRLYPRQLSGGMKQRVSLARAVLADAPVLLLDEPFKELDGVLRDAVAELLREEATRRLVLFSAHSEEEARALGAIPLSLVHGS